MLLCSLLGSGPVLGLDWTGLDWTGLFSSKDACSFLPLMMCLFVSTCLGADGGVVVILTGPDLT
jgi:hypothetical protein